MAGLGETSRDTIALGSPTPARRQVSLAGASRREKPRTTVDVCLIGPCVDVAEGAKTLRSSESDTEEGENQEGDKRQVSHGGSRLNLL